MPNTVSVVALVPLFYMGDHPVGDRFQMNEGDVQCHLNVNMVSVCDTEGPVEQIVAPTLPTTLEELLALWDVSMSPSEYLTSFPEGEHSTLALQIVELEAEKQEAAVSAANAAVQPISTASVPS